jgi:pilus assembly protein FimV
MMKSKLKLTLAIALCLGSSQALALQLGQIRVKSALDERLVAEIPVQLDNLTEAKHLSVGLASEADFQRAGLSRAGLEHLRFSVVNDTTGHKLVLVTSEQPITAPYLDFLVQVDTAKGKQLREYTVLLDPVIAGPGPQITSAPTTAPAPVTQPAAAPVAPAPQPAPAAPPPASMFSAPVQQPHATPPPAPAAPAQAAPVAAAPAQPRSGEYQVNKGDTLYHIASETRPDAQVSVDQMMLALQRTNPDAFYRENINALKSGAILRIPTRDAVNAASVAEARAQVHRQMEDWRGAAARKATTVVQNNAAPAASAPAGKAAPSNASSDRLALVPPSQGGGNAASRPGEKGGTGTAEVANLKQQLATAKESLASLKQGNADLQSRVKDLEDIGSKNQKLLGMKDAEIAELQRKLAEAQQRAAKTAAGPAAHGAPLAAGASSVANAPKSAAGTAAPVAASSGAAQTPASTNAATAPAAGTAVAAKPAPAAKPEAKAAPQNPQNQGIAEPWYRQSLTWIIAGVAILGLILLGLVRRRPKPLPEPEDETPLPADHFGGVPAVAEETPEELVHEEPLYTEEPPEQDDAASDEAVASMPEDHAQQPAGDEYGFSFDELPPEEPVAQPGMAAPQPPVAGAGDITHVQSLAELDDYASAPAGHSESPVQDDDDTREHPVPSFSDDPVDTKLDLARAYLDMGDPEGARAMLEEVINEGSQMQKDEAKRLLEDQT